MKKIMVIGVSSGVGKSTFALKLGEIIGIQVHHLDALFWKPGWEEATLVEFTAAQERIIANDEWIIEGNYTNTFDLRMEHADTMIYIELPLYICLIRVFKRWFMNIGKTRPDVGEGCTEKIDWPFIKFIFTTYGPRKGKMQKRLKAFRDKGGNRATYYLKNKKEIKSFIHSIQQEIKK